MASLNKLRTNISNPSYIPASTHGRPANNAKAKFSNFNYFDFDPGPVFFWGRKVVGNFVNELPGVVGDSSSFNEGVQYKFSTRRNVVRISSKIPFNPQE